MNDDFKGVMEKPEGMITKKIKLDEVEKEVFIGLTDGKVSQGKNWWR